MSLTEQSWYLDRRVPMAIIAAIILQSAGALVWVGQATQRIKHMEQKTQLIAEVSERIARLEENTSFMRTSLQRVERKIDLLHTAKASRER